ncbi:carboxypeptidase B-like [Sitodiplosis mosellana]|uniref:carboxypeptidase B-like n=1 Tax=Sitodiplosis mosellana TaxID=263140 RepID=UPI00244402A4|nr:carboxypeptidase B-like [Sitodiplosis mosellana]
MVETDLKDVFISGSVSKTTSMKSSKTVPDFRYQYLSHCDINTYLDTLQAKYPHLVKIKTIGYSFERRALKSIHISTSMMTKVNELEPVNKKAKSTLNGINRSKSALKRKQVVLIDGGMHAREWCTISTALHCASQLTDNFDENKNLLEIFDFVIVPCVNIDGYEFSRCYKKMWRKSRRPIEFSKFIGVDFNRNFSVGWETASQKTSSCTYRGEKPFSEPETRIIKRLMHSLKPTFYLTLHSFSKSIMFPYAFTSMLPYNWMSLHSLAKAAGQAIQKETGTKFRIGSVASIIKNAKASGGGSVDYAHKTAKIPFVIVMELSGGSFQPPAIAINGVLLESWIGIHAMCSFLKNRNKI